MKDVAQFKGPQYLDHPEQPFSMAYSGCRLQLPEAIINCMACLIEVVLVLVLVGPVPEAVVHPFSFLEVWLFHF